MRGAVVGDRRLFALLLVALALSAMGVACSTSVTSTPGRSATPLAAASETASEVASPTMPPTATTKPTPSPTVTPTLTATPTSVSFDTVLDAYPLRPGNRWIWYIEFDKGGGQDETRVYVSRTMTIVTDTVTFFEVDGPPVAVAQIEREGEPGSWNPPCLNYLLLQDQVYCNVLDYKASYLRLLHDIGMLTGTCILWYEFPLVDGNVWPSVSFGGPPPSDMYVWHVALLEKPVDVPVGSFEGCSELSMANPPITLVEILCPGIGPVQRTYTFYHEERWTLVGYQLDSGENVMGPTPTPRPTYTPYVFAIPTPDPTP